jgi:hypothetical protein
MVKDGGIVTAFDPKTGDEIYMQRLPPVGNYASPVAANGHIYSLLEDGVVTVLKAGADKPDVVAKNPPLGERVAPHRPSRTTPCTSGRRSTSTLQQGEVRAGR